MAKKITALQLFKQHQKIKELKEKVSTEESNLRDLVQAAGFLSEIVNVNGRIYRVRSLTGHTSWHNRVEIEFVGDCAEVAKVL
jgi:hypothetical protein